MSGGKLFSLGVLTKPYHQCTIAGMSIFEQVKAIQINRRLTDVDMAELLGYGHRMVWTRIKCGQNPAGRLFERRALKAFPEIRT